MDCSPPHSSVLGIFQARILEWLPFPSPGNLPHSGTEPISPVSPVLQADSLPAKSWGSLRNSSHYQYTGMGGGRMEKRIENDLFTTRWYAGLPDKYSASLHVLEIGGLFFFLTVYFEKSQMNRLVQRTLKKTLRFTINILPHLLSLCTQIYVWGGQTS